MTQAPLSSDQVSELDQFARSLNAELEAIGADRAEQAFGLGCGLGIMPLGALVLALWVLQVINLILAFILAAMAGLALVGVAALLAYRARRRAIQHAYHTTQEREISRFLSARTMSRAQFDTLAYRQLPEGAPLLDFLSPIRKESDELLEG